MTALETGCIIALLLACAALLGTRISRRLPDHHLSTDSRKPSSLPPPLSALFRRLHLVFLVASAKTAFDDAETELKTSAARLVLLDRVLGQYGTETAQARERLANVVEARIAQAWGGAAGEALRNENAGRSRRRTRPEALEGAGAEG